MIPRARAAGVVLSLLLQASVATSQSAALGPEPPEAGLRMPALEVGIGSPGGLAVDRSGNLYVSSRDLRRVFRRDASGVLTVVAGCDERDCWPEAAPGEDAAMPALRTALGDPAGLAVAEGRLYIADAGAGRIRRLDLETGNITTVVAAGGTTDASQSALGEPVAIALDPSGGAVVADRSRHRVVRIDLAGRRLSTLAGDGLPGHRGDGGAAREARLDSPAGLAFDGRGNLYIADRGNHVVRRVDAGTGIIDTVAGTGRPGASGDGGPARSASLSEPAALAVNGEALYIADAGSGLIRQVDLKTAGIRTVSQLQAPTALAVSASQIAVADAARRLVLALGPEGRLEALVGNGGLGYAGNGRPATQAFLREPRGLVVDAGGRILVAERAAHRVRSIDPVTGALATVAGTGRQGFDGDGGKAVNASLNQPSGVAVDPAGNLYIADRGNHRIRRVGVDGTIVSLPGPEAWEPLDVAVARGSLFVADVAGRVFRVDLATGAASVVVGREQARPLTDGEIANAGTLAGASGLAVSAKGDLFVGESRERRVRRIDGRTGRVTTVAGKYDANGALLIASSVPLSLVEGLAFGPSGELLIADLPGGVYRLDLRSASITRLAGGGDRVPGQGREPATAVRIAARGVAVEASGAVIVSEASGRILRVRTDGLVETIAGGGPGF